MQIQRRYPMPKIKIRNDLDPICGLKRGSTGPCIKPKGHREDKTSRHWDGKYEWGTWW